MYDIKRLAESPAIAQSLGLSFQRATPLITRARGVPPKKMIPARNPPGVPQPKPGTPIHPGRMKNQGDEANQKLIFPNAVDCMLLYFSVIIDRSVSPGCETNTGVARSGTLNKLSLEV
jgi:hypothetical protein